MTVHNFKVNCLAQIFFLIFENKKKRKMAIYMAAILLFDDKEDDAYNQNIEVLRITRRRLKDASDPFSISDNEFSKLYR